MAQAPPESFQGVRFDLGRGLVCVDETSYRVLVPGELLSDLLGRASAETARDFGQGIGAEIGRRVSNHLGTQAKVASVETVLGELGAEFSLTGLGSLGVERWGRALVMTVQGSPLGPRGDALLASVLEGALARGLERDAAVVPLDRSDGLVRLLVLSPAAAPRVREWLAAGTPWSEALTRLHFPAARAGGGE